MAEDNLIAVNLRGFDLKFKTKPGVFSKQGIDAGTMLLLDNIEVEDGTVVADLGCGTGVIGIVAAKLNKRGHVHLLDDHLRVTELAKENVELNNLKNAEVHLSDLFSAVGDRTYHQIFSNPPQHLGNEFLDELVRECYKHLKSKGKVYWVIQKHLKPFVLKLLEKHFKNAEVIAKGREHMVIMAEKLP